MPKISAYIPDPLAERLEQARAAGQEINQSSLLQEALERRLAELNRPADARIAALAIRYRELREVEVALHRAAYDFILESVESWPQPPSLHAVTYLRNLCRGCASGQEGEFEEFIQEFDANPLEPDPVVRSLFEHVRGGPISPSQTPKKAVPVDQLPDLFVEQARHRNDDLPEYRRRQQSWLGMEQAFNDLLAAMREQDQAILREEVNAEAEPTRDERP